MDYLVISPSDECLDPERPYHTTRFSSPYTDSTNYDNQDDYFTTEHPHSKFIIGSFIPLPSIIASPACTPTTSSSGSGDNTFTDGSLSPRSNDDFKTAPSSPADSQCFTAPTCIYTPPTPPPKMARRSVTCFASPPSVLSSSASLPASIPPHENRHSMKRSASVPTRSRQTRYATGENSAIGDAMNPSGPANLLQRTLIATFNAGIVKSSTSRKLSMRRSKPIFHLATDIEEDVSRATTASPEPLLEEESTEDNNFIDSDAELSWLSEKSKDDLRRYYGLRELLATEVGYLMDLRAFVNIYLRLLPSLVCRSTSGTSFSRASSFTSNPWASSNASQIHGITTLPDTNTTSTVPTTRPAATRHIFSEQDIDVLTRNAHELLQLHEQFVEELRADLLPLGFHMDSDQPTDDFGDLKQTLQNTDAAIHLVSTKFATEASRFASYELFCVGHPEALDLVRKAQSQHPVEWDAFEHKCALLIQNMELTPGTPSRAASEHDGSSEENGLIEEQGRDRTRASSLSSVEGAVRTLRRRTSNVSSKEGSPITENYNKKDKGSRLAFDDYLIKPVQRICKYPLIMDQLKHGRSLRSNFPVHTRSNTQVVVESAAQAMRHVATAVDEARRKQDVALQSSRIASRLVLSIPPPSPGSPIQALSQSFMSSLETCLLAGSLDVIHIHSSKQSTTSIHAKYLGAFLYPGGYLILAKVSKAKVYEPKHWFALTDFDIVDVEEDDSMLPCSIRLTSKEHHFELAAACQREKDLWFTSIQEALEQPHDWINEPISSIRCDGKGDLIPSALDDGPFELVNALPTIQSIPELANSPSELTEPMSATSSESSKQRSPKLEATSTPKREVEPPSRRSSTASVKAIFSPNPTESDTIIIRRSSASARSRVDQGLQDVISPPCLKARSHAFIQDEELFQVPKASRSSFVRSQSGLSVASLAKGRLTRHESFRVVRRKSLLESSESASRRPSSIAAMGTMPRRYSRGLQLTAVQGSSSRGSPSPQSASPSSSFLISSLSSLHGSLGRPPTRPPSPSPQAEPLGSTKGELPIKPSRSLVSNVREFFSSRSSSTAPPSRTNSTQGIVSNEVISKKQRKALHRRTQSTPDSPAGSVSLPAIEKLPPLDIGNAMAVSSTRSPRSSQDRSSGPKSLLTATIRISPSEIDSDRGTNQHRPLLQCMTA